MGRRRRTPDGTGGEVGEGNRGGVCNNQDVSVFILKEKTNPSLFWVFCFTRCVQ